MNIGNADTYEVEYTLGSGTKTQKIASESKPSENEALQKIADPQFMMVPKEDISVLSIKKVKEEGTSIIDESVFGF